MTALCGGGASEAKPGFSQTAVITGAVLDSALVVVGLETLAAALAPFIAGTVYDLTQFCNTDPPADPGLTAQDIIDVNNFVDPTVSIPALLKVKQWFESWYWYDACQCSSVGTPAAPSPSNPGNVVGYNPGLPSGPSGPCWNVTQTYTTVASSGVGVAVLKEANSLLLPATAPHAAPNPANWPFSTPLLTIPAGVQNIVLTLSMYPDVNAPNVQMFLILDTFDASGNLVRQLDPLLQNGNTHPNTVTVTGPLGSNELYWGIYFDSKDTVSHNLTATVSFSCNQSSSGFSSTPCCPPDPSLDTRLAQIYGLLQSVYQSLPSPLNSYASGTVHSGLTGNGTVTLSAEVLAVRVDITTDSAHLGESAGDPVYLFDRGYIVPVINSAPVRQPSRLVYNPQLFPLPQLTEQIGYSLGPGIVASITELTAGP